jgi:hypothetical protein
MSSGHTLQQLRESPVPNIGGADLVSRAVTVIVLLVLTGMVAAEKTISFSVMKISLLIAAELGLVSVMLGLFLRSNTYFAGIQLLIAALSMLWLAAHDLTLVAVSVGLLFIAVDLTNVVTRRSRLNALLASHSPRLPDVEPPLAPPKVDPVRTPEPGASS